MISSRSRYLFTGTWLLIFCPVMNISTSIIKSIGMLLRVNFYYAQHQPLFDHSYPIAPMLELPLRVNRRKM